MLIEPVERRVIEERSAESVTAALESLPASTTLTKTSTVFNQSTIFGFLRPD